VVTPRASSTVVRSRLPDRIVPGVGSTTFSFPESGPNLITPDIPASATNCPEYKVTPVQVMPVAQPSAWQRSYARFNTAQLDLLERRAAAPAAVTTGQ
ncbi:hypothetical protein, partial [Burkholderia cenocepacia]|uniref:hypothetical protein n=1 Tax=Burkholderia cenocepacia TaxID=95486 RepID=UPI00406CBF31